MKTAIQLKALINNMARNKNIDPQILLRNYMLERLLERIAMSEYHNNFILKGGMLVAAIVGVDNRSTIDMDATIKSWPVSSDNIRKMFDEILSIQLNDSVEMKLLNIIEIREEDEYEGIRLSIESVFDKIKLNIKVDITTGEEITPKEIKYHFKLMFENRYINVIAYNIETILAEKLETVISRSVTNTRMRDFYDIYLLSSMNYDASILNIALCATTKKRGTYDLLDKFEKILSEIENSTSMTNYWNRYKNSYSYVKDIKWSEIMSAVKLIFSKTLIDE